MSEFTKSQIRFREPTGLMFHHFDGAGHPVVQGSIDGAAFRSILEAVGLANILSAELWLQKAMDGTLKASDTCITFDDALLCQYDIAKPVLDELGIRAFWFVYTSIFEGVVEKLELFRYFRSTQFADINDFYRPFFSVVERHLGARYSEHKRGFSAETYLPNSPFYTDEDRWFRYLRDQVLGQEHYFTIVEQMMDEVHFDRHAAAQRLWLRAEQVRELADADHVIGLHSHTHPTTMGKLARDVQEHEYRTNAEHLYALSGKRARVMSHPCNSYNQDTINVLTDLDVEVGFRADMASIRNRTPLEFSREDHANLMQFVRGE